MKTLMIFLIGLTSAAVAAPTDQLWFTGKRAPLDAFSQGAGAVHLRWGVTEGTLPVDVAGFAIEIEGETIYETAAQPRPSRAAVLEVYARYPRHQAIAAARIRDAGEGEDFAGVIAARIAGRDAGDGYWRRLTGRLDPVIAQLSGRAVILRDGAAGTYRLFAVAQDGRRALLGEVPVGAIAQSAQAPANAQQVFDLGRCDGPEVGRNDGVVALTWDLPGAARSVDRLAFGLDLAGFEVYRADTADHPEVRFAQAAAGAPLDARGMPRMSGLTRVNRAPIAPTSPPSSGKDARYKAWNPDFAQWLSTADDVAKAGLKPGDRRTYFVVARDVAGNFGDAARVEVIVPDALAPPAPWSVRALPQQTDARGSGRLRLSWWHVDARNVHDARPGRPWCNLATAVSDGRLSFAGSDADCGTPAGQINVSVDHYKIYRFDNQVTAAQFTDTDGDGVSDADERIARPGNLSMPGSACAADDRPANAVNYLVGEARVVTRRGGRAVVEFVDPLSDALRKGTHYWYRIASVGQNAKIGALSAPIRGFFPDLDKPPRLDAADMIFGYCPVRARAGLNTGLSVIDTTGLAVEAELFCSSAAPAYRYGREPIIELDGQRGIAAVDTPGGCDTTIRFLDASGRVLGEATFVQNNPRRMEDFTARLFQDCANPAPIEDGATAAAPHFIELPAELPANTCVDLLRTTNGERHRITTLCDPGAAWYGELRPLSGALACYSVQPVNGNGVTGTLTPLGCVRGPEVAAPAAPSLTRLIFEGNRGVVSWRAPAAHVGGILLEWRQVGGDARGADYITAPGSTAPGQALTATFDAPALGANPERWCARARSYGRGFDPLGQVSAWTPELCIERAPPGTPAPQFLGWPSVPKARDAGTLAVRYLEGDLAPAIALSDLDSPVIGRDECSSFPNLFDCDEDTSCASGPRLFIGCDICGHIDAALADNRRFVVYRQRRDGQALTPYVQVSPRIDGTFCRPSCSDPFGCDEDAEDLLSLAFCGMRQRAEQACGANPGQVPQGVYDPHLSLLAFDQADDWPELTLAFVDRTPHKAGAEYRYQLVYFDARGEISAKRLTPWLQIPEENAL